jgi:hypothetical protein
MNLISQQLLFCIEAEGDDEFAALLVAAFCPDTAVFSYIVNQN